MTTSPLTPIPLSEVLAEYDRGEWGFTGTRAGMTGFQMQMTRRFLLRGQPIIFRHGGAWGGDEEAHNLWERVCRTSTAEVWPADEKRAAIFRNRKRVTVQGVRDPLSRNIRIVDASIFMIAAPNKEFEEQRSGTWQAIRAAIQRERPVLIMWPQSHRLTLHRNKTLYRVSHTIRDDT